ncbi:2-oxoacid:acceptor oxidoreductase family protein [Desulfosporosinus youngiae]|uniref:2-oxoacid:acceptor oxidoreductase, gamma subunit, pyruvate/2-ketoisovalerate family n=1 Tax=Desulfosporosinus youngiae DSM 17734 TaxID=768710 RepID=H5Y150_9FIRM|nr:2-oxoacid:acceptor oxidoreductase family protein [Desulfosporosinus youngiae]EHQ87270.1 2-oxoacid:acceptor oxidoreductase, gamma subunit, pyruvate/2-ketoisovalerate family [Desulfosporosinus youngiae DSM 17734]
MAKVIKIALAGEGGQGVQSVAQIMTNAANDAGKEALYIPNFGVEQRGGVSIAFCQISEDKIGAPKFEKGDIVIALSERAVVRCQQYVGRETIFVYEASIEGADEYLPQNAKRVLAIPALKTANEELHPRVFNVIILGATLKATGILSLEDARKALESKLGYKFEQNPKLRELNFKALERGAEIIEELLVSN